jgi:glyoxylate reductase
MKKAYLTRKIPEPGPSLLKNAGCELTVHPHAGPPTKDQILESVAGKNAIVCTVSDRIDKEVMDAAGPGLKVISSYSSGYDHIDLKEATARGIYVTYVYNVPAEATADLAFALILACARRITDGDSFVKQNRWKIGWSPDLLVGHNVHGATLGIIGLGKIGSAVARRARGFSMRIQYYDQMPKPNGESMVGAEYTPLDRLLETSDFVSIHTSLNSNSYHMIDKSKLQRMKKTAFLINTSRGHVVNEADLAEILLEGRIAGAGLDVFESEPISEDNPLLRARDLIVFQPHIGCATYETRAEMAQVAANNLLDVLEGRTPKPYFLANPDVSMVRPLPIARSEVSAS